MTNLPASLPFGVADIANYLDIAFSLVHPAKGRGWARETLLDSSPATIRSMVSKVGPRPFSATLSALETCREHSPLDHAGQASFDHRIQCDALLMPSFESAGIGIGNILHRIEAVDEEERAAVDDDDNERCMFTPGGSGRERPETEAVHFNSRFHMGRFVVNLRTGAVLVVKHTAAEGETQVLFFKPVSTTKRRRVSLQCNTNQFKGAWEREGEEEKFAHLEKSVEACFTSVETTDCAQCLAKPEASCGCNLELVLEDKFHFAGAKAVASTLAGEYLGNTEMAVCIRERGKERSRYISKSLIAHVLTNYFSRDATSHKKLEKQLFKLAEEVIKEQVAVARRASARGLDVQSLRNGVDDMGLSLLRNSVKISSAVELPEMHMHCFAKGDSGEMHAAMTTDSDAALPAESSLVQKTLPFTARRNRFNFGGVRSSTPLSVAPPSSNAVAEEQRLMMLRQQESNRASALLSNAKRNASKDKLMARKNDKELLQKAVHNRLGRLIMKRKRVSLLVGRQKIAD